MAAKNRGKNSVRRHSAADRSKRNELRAAVGTQAASILDSVFAFLLSAGMKPDEIAAVAHERMSRLNVHPPRFSVEPWAAWVQLGEAVCDWWRDARYVGTDGRPAPLRETGPAPSVDALLAAHVSPSNLVDAKAMLERCVERSDDGLVRFALDSPALMLRGEQGVHRLHVLLTGLLQTFIENNLSRRPVPQQNYEKSAASATFPVSMLPALRVRMKKHLDLAIEDANAWITRHSENALHEPVCVAGVEMFLFTLVPEPRRPPRGRSTRA